MADTGVTKPTNKIVVSGTPLIVEKKVKTATNMYPGRLVKYSTSDVEIVVNTAAGKAIGWLGYEQANHDYKPADVDTAYSADDFAPELFGGHFIINGRLASGESVNPGERLVAAANGELKAGSAMTVTIASGTTTVLSDKAQPDENVSGAYGSEGIVVAIAMETVDASAAAKDIAVLSLI